MHPSSVRYGGKEGWPLGGETIESGLQCKGFLKYVDHLIYSEMTEELGTILGECKIIYGKEAVVLSIPLYDRLLEVSLREKVINGIEESVLYDRLLYIKRLILLEGYKYFGMKMEVEFYFLSLGSMPSLMISRYIAVHLEQNHKLPDLFRNVSEELRGGQKKGVSKEVGLLAHRPRSSFSSDSSLYKGRMVGDRLLLGYRMDCVGRFSRKQRASRESLIVGRVSLGNFRGHLDYGSAAAIMTYGVSNVRVWRYLNRYEKEWNYLLKVK